MKIANPIYDVVFKYLMEDSKIAKLLIGSIIGEKIVELDFFPQEHTVLIKKDSLTVYHVDFIAKIKTSKGFKCILIEIQKAKFETDIMRFRKYLGSQYANQENSYQYGVKKNGKPRKKPLPIVSIYFLGYPLKGITAPIIKVKRHYYDVANHDEEIKQKVEFIESLTHDSFVIQIPYLRQKYQTDLEGLLSVFDQHNRSENDHVLTIKEEDYPKKYRSVIRRLQSAIVEPEIRYSMDVEDDILEELEDKEREIAKIEEEKSQLSQALDEKNKSLEEKDKLIRELMEKVQQSDL
ncbi:MAG: hypothetical protein GQ569_01420 [Methylococcaceae bacterium]|nr:hypothetical protein [Methylococcaceae bacterium]